MRRLLAALLSVLALSLAVASAAEATPSSPVTIVTSISFASDPPSGTFTVPEGSDTLGCSGGTFFDSFLGSGVIRKNFTCTSGPASGDTFVVLFFPGRVPGPGDQNGPWSTLSGTGDFAKLHGTGNFSVVFTGPDSGVETLTGSIHFD
jgi:hypothetical protein